MTSNSSTYLFLSDIHLGGFSTLKNKEIENEFHSIIRWAIQNKITVFLLGDIFDYWMEFKSGFYPNEFDSTLSVLKELTSQQSENLFITGNHDNWTLGLFKKMGFDVEEQFRFLNIDDTSLFVCHGDGILEKNSFKRPLLHRLLRNKLFLRVFKTLFPDRLGIQVMKYFSLLNRILRPTKSDSSRKLNEWAKAFVQEKNCDFMICGHDHIPRTIRLNQCKYINLGAFFVHKTFALYTNSEIELVTWKQEINQPVAFKSEHEY